MPDLHDYTVGWICAVRIEYVAALVLLDEEHEEPDFVNEHDDNVYSLGRIGKHNIVITTLPQGQYGLVSAATAARDLVHSFPNVRIGFMVGIGGGAPSDRHDVRLGDIVVSSPNKNGIGGVLQYDFGKTVQNGKFVQTGFLNQPPKLLLSAVQKLQARYDLDGSHFENSLEAAFVRKPRLRHLCQWPDPSTDNLYRASYIHSGGSEDGCATVCGNDKSQLIARKQRALGENEPVVHHGLIASANQLMKDALIRDALSEEKDILCFEMEAAGLMNHFPCLVIRGICDYSDTHKNDIWHGYAAIAAASYARDLLNTISPRRVEAQKKLGERPPEDLMILGKTETALTALHIVQEDVMQVQHGIEYIKESSQNDKIKQRLSPTDPSINFQNALRQRQPGTGQWLLEHDSYLAWKSGTNSFLWLHGIPGCGKTVLSSIVIEDIEHQIPRSVLYFYFTFTDRGKQTLESAIKSLACQLYDLRPNTRHHFQLLLSNIDPRQPSHEELCDTLATMIQTAGEIWIVLDALDECTTRYEYPTGGLLMWLQDIRKRELGIHLLVTSRLEADIESAIEAIARVENIVSLQSGQVGSDIDLYVKTRVRDGAGLKRWKSNPDVQSEIEFTLVQKADGMFRWVACQLDALEKCLNYRSVKDTLDTLPKTLDETYARVLASLPLENQTDVTRLLQFLTFSEHSLEVDEVVDALATDATDAVERAPFDPKNRMPDPRELKKLCPSLITLTTEGDVQAKVYIHLAHLSVREYLTSGRLSEPLSHELTLTVASTCITNVCLRYLIQINDRLVNEVKFDDTGRASKETVEDAYPLMHHAIHYWPTYAVKAAGHIDATDLASLITKFISCNIIFNHRLVQYHIRLPTPRWRLSTLSLASAFGLGSVVNSVLQQGENRQELRGALHLASGNGHENIVRMLLEHSTRINAQDDWYYSALMGAATEGHEGVVRLLLDNIAQSGNKSTVPGTALVVAASGGFLGIVRLLLEHGAQVDSFDGISKTALPLPAASLGGHEDVVRLLLQHGAPADAVGLSGTSLEIASLSGQEGVVQILLDHGAQTNGHQGGRDYGNALHAAFSYYGLANSDSGIRVIRLLLGRGADPNAKDETGKTLLHRALDHYQMQDEDSGGKKSVKLIRLLLDNGANSEIPDADGMTPLHHAASTGKLEEAGMLLDGGADVYAVDRGGWTPLDFALARESFAMAKLLWEGWRCESCDDKRAPLFLQGMASESDLGRWMHRLTDVPDTTDLGKIAILPNSPLSDLFKVVAPEVTDNAAQDEQKAFNAIVEDHDESDSPADDIIGDKGEVKIQVGREETLRDAGSILKSGKRHSFRALFSSMRKKVSR
ncbi:hypothetical protein F4808DRAFT_463616 [Astrocystis sublimbata]|nr:hypothetical protein F4808DRAFT_463616 [Astrocystis sublimbata]